MAGVVCAAMAVACSAPLPVDGGSPSTTASTTPSASSSSSEVVTPRRRPVFGPVTEVALGGANLCVVLLDGQVQCVGEWPLEFETP